ncbi:MAG: 1-(5-phosphoribosyl)-5-((5-phosphoribosylamino)methylideneamino) imidazole-4-carboxamide isomerase [Syntrophorhabdus sp. PtaU1.Bin050]|nr:MAG: 1-(5-phosphoribosyl)-5-((5-phosphoribosylamino)methylideneamino) imidazole-4-carboxamide isomerase [Syntrophorhabdus sp. PtaU1.Bin050]
MKALFAMDLMGGACVRLIKGDFAKVTVYSRDPVSKIEELIRQGAQDFHIIDLDGARTGQPVHQPVIRMIREKVQGYMEVGGGIRQEKDIRDYSASGVSGVIVGTQALEDDTFFEGLSAYNNIVLGLDVLDGKPMVRGWKNSVDKDINEILEASERVGIMAILCTNVAKDGMLSGPDYEGMKQMVKRTKIPLIASGGVTSIDDVKMLKDLGVWAVILGKAIYEGLIKVEEAVQYAD